MPIRRCNRIHHINLEPIPLAERPKYLDISRALPAKTMIVSDQQLAQPEPAAKNDLHKVFSRKRSKLGACTPNPLWYKRPRMLSG